MFCAWAGVHVVWAIFIFLPDEHINFGDLRCSECVLWWAHLLRFYLMFGNRLSFYSFLYPSLKKCGVSWYTLRTKICVDCLRPSVTILIPLSILSIFSYRFFFKLYIRVAFAEEWFGIVYGWILLNKHRVIAIDVFWRLVSVLYLGIFMADSIQT